MSAPSGGTISVQRLSNSEAKPASGPECSVPAIGWVGTKCTPSGTCGPTASTTAALTEPTSITVAPGFRCGAMASATTPIAPTGTASTIRSAPSTAASALSQTVSQSWMRRAVSRVACERA